MSTPLDPALAALDAYCARKGYIANVPGGRRIGQIDPVSGFINLRKSATDCQQPVLLADRLRAGKAEALAQPYSGFATGPLVRPRASIVAQKPPEGCYK